MPEYTNLSDVIVDGRIESSAQGGVMGSFAVMPTASALNENCIVLYTGTTGTYVSGRFYRCVESGGSYSWQPVTISGTEAPVFTASRALVSDSLGAASASSVTATELAYLSGLTGNLVTLLNGKVDKVSGMGLSQNSYTTDEKNKLAGIAAGAEVNVISAVQNNGVAVEVVGKTVNITHPTLLSQFTNDTQFITSTVANLQNYYDKATVNDMISAIPKFAISVVDELPSSGQSSTTIYLAPKAGSSGDVYDEYLWVNDTWEKIGSTAVQFSFDQSGTDILINGTAIRSATSAQSGVMTTAQVSELTTATSNITNLQSQYSSLNGTVSSLSSRLDTAESTLSTTASQVSTLDERVSGVESEVSSFDSRISVLESALSSKLGVNDTAYAASRDGSGNIISATYATKSEVEASTPLLSDITVNAGSTFTVSWTVLNPGLLSGLTATADVSAYIEYTMKHYSGSTSGPYTELVKFTDMQIDNSELVSGTYKDGTSITNHLSNQGFSPSSIRNKTVTGFSNPSCTIRLSNGQTYTG